MIDRRQMLIGGVAALTVGVPALEPTPTPDVICTITDLDIVNNHRIEAVFHRLKAENRVIRDECRMAWLITAAAV